MKEEKKKDDDFEMDDFEVDPIITLIALIGAVITMIFGFPHLDFPDDWGAYILGTVVLTFAYIIGLSLLVAIIVLLIASIMCLFSKKNKESD